MERIVLRVQDTTYYNILQRHPTIHHLIPGAVLYKSRVRPLNPDQKGNLQDQIDKCIEQGVIEPLVSPWVLPLIPVTKKDGRTRWVTDL